MYHKIINAQGFLSISIYFMIPSLIYQVQKMELRKIFQDFKVAL